VRFICGTQDIHKELERKIAEFLGTEDTILYAAAFDANGGVFEPLYGEQDAIISDELNHASIIDGVRLCKAQRFRYKHNDMADLEAQLKAASNARNRVIASDGSLRMDGTIAQLDKICDLADQYNAAVMIDECPHVGFLGKTGRETHEYRGVMGRIIGTLGGIGRSKWWRPQWKKGKSRDAQTKKPAVLIFQQPGSIHRGCIYRCIGYAE
jgi:glycine C-acetyltransferase